MAQRTENFREWVPFIEKLPPGTWFDLNETQLELQAYTREQSRKMRGHFPGLIWKKSFQEGVGWWDYTAELAPGKTVRIYADREGPNSCKKIEETITETIHVPACEAHEAVRVSTRVRWVCPEEESK